MLNFSDSGDHDPLRSRDPHPRESIVRAVADVQKMLLMAVFTSVLPDRPIGINPQPIRGVERQRQFAPMKRAPAAAGSSCPLASC